MSYKFKGILKAKTYLDLSDSSIKIVTEQNKEYDFTDMREALLYFEGLGYWNIRITELFLKIPRIEKTLHFEERHDPRGLGIDGYMLYCVTPITKEEAEIIEGFKKKHGSFLPLITEFEDIGVV